MTVGLPDYEAVDRTDRNAKTYDYINTFRKRIFHDEYTMLQLYNETLLYTTCMIFGQ